MSRSTGSEKFSLQVHTHIVQYGLDFALVCSTSSSSRDSRLSIILVTVIGMIRVVGGGIDNNGTSSEAHGHAFILYTCAYFQITNFGQILGQVFDQALSQVLHCTVRLGQPKRYMNMCFSNRYDV